MARDHRKLAVFAAADQLVIETYAVSQHFPATETFGLQAQLRRAAVSIPSNIVEGSSRRTTGEYLRFLNIAAGSAVEAAYLVGLSMRLGLLGQADGGRIKDAFEHLAAQLHAIVRPEAGSRKPEAVSTISDVNRVRRRVHAWATLWLVCQLAAVSAFVPRDCCAAHRPAALAAQSQTGHGSHEGHGAHGDHQPVDHDQDCVMRGVCNGPLDAIATLFMGPGLPLQPFTLLDTTTAVAGPRAADASALDSLRLPSTPPPRG